MGVYTRKLSHRTCEYCGIVAATPAALQRHIRKHTGERPFVCHVCHKAYKAKRSLHCHQLSNHPQLFNGSSADLHFPGLLSRVSPSTSHLLREKIESRHGVSESDERGVDLRMTAPGFNPLLSGRASSSQDLGNAEDKDTATDDSHTPNCLDQSKSPSSADTTHDLGINVSTLTFSSEGGDLEGEDLSARNSCPICFKTFGKPSDLKRHLLSHTSIRPFTCQVCNKAFRQTGSLNYHLRVTHQLNVPLSQGLEARAHLRLKRIMGPVPVDGWREAGLATSLGLDNHEVKPKPFVKADSDLPPLSHSLPVPKFLATCSASNLNDFHQGLSRQTSLANSEASSWPDDKRFVDRGGAGDSEKGNNIVEVELPPYLVYDRAAFSEGISNARSPKVQMLVRGETDIFTQLDGVCVLTGRPMQVFRCGFCRKVQASLFAAVSHLAKHFDPKGVLCSPTVPPFSPPLPSSSSSSSLECSQCQLVFASKPEMAVHFQHKHNRTLNNLDLQNNNHRNFVTPFTEEGEEENETEDGLARKGTKDRESFGLFDDLNNNNQCKGDDADLPSAKEIAVSSFSKYSLFSPNSKSLYNNYEEFKEVAYVASTSSKLTSSFVTPQEKQLSFGDGCLDQPLYSGKGSYRCPKCCKCYMTSFLLDRHLKFHSRQSAIQAAMKSGAAVNGAHKDLLLNPPPVLMQNADKFFRELSREVRTGEPEKKVNYRQEIMSNDGKDKTRRIENSQDIDSLQKQNADADNDVKVVFDTKKLTQQDDLQEDIVVVMPSDPDLDPEKPPEFDLEQPSDCDCVRPCSMDTPSEWDAEKSSDIPTSVDSVDMDTETSESEILASPKRRLNPYGKEGLLPSKSRRKSSLPTRFRSRDSDETKKASENFELPPPVSQQQRPEPSSSSSSISSLSWQPQMECSGDVCREEHDDASFVSHGASSSPGPASHAGQATLPRASPGISSSPKLHPGSPDMERGRSSESSETREVIKLGFGEEFLRAQQKQSHYLQTIHAAFGGHAVLGSQVTGNLAAMAGYLRQFGPTFAPGVVPPFGLHAASSSLLSPSLTLPLPHPLSPSPNPTPVKEEEDVEEKAEDLSISSSVSSSKTLNSSSVTLDLTSRQPHKPDALVGCPKVQWGASAPPSESEADAVSKNRFIEAGIAEGSVLPGRIQDRLLLGCPGVQWDSRLRSDDEGDGDESRSPVPEGSTDANGKPSRTVWHLLSAEDLSGPTAAADGRKVTSLSRTHSRLYVVNQPVDREQLCKPTLLPDGRTVFKCYFCHKDFLSYSDINRHMDFHEDIRPYKCNFCEYYARTNSQLKVHMMRHQGIRGFCCRLCNYKGVTQSDLNRHMKSQIHLLKSGNECRKCGEGFVTAKNLEKHLVGGCDGKHKMDVGNHCQ